MNMMDKIAEIQARGKRIDTLVRSIRRKSKPHFDTIPDWPDCYMVSLKEKPDKEMNDVALNNLAGMLEMNNKQVDKVCIVENQDGYAIVVGYK